MGKQAALDPALPLATARVDHRTKTEGPGTLISRDDRVFGRRADTAFGRVTNVQGAPLLRARADAATAGSPARLIEERVKEARISSRLSN